MKFSSIKEGNLLREPVSIPLTWVDEQGVEHAELTIDMRKLSPGERLKVLERTRAAAIMKGAEHVGVGDPVYEQQLHAQTLAVALVDHDSPKDKPEPFFESVDQLFASQFFSDDVLEYLYARYEAFVSLHSLQQGSLSTAQMYALVAACAEDEADAIPFFNLSRVMQWHFVRFMAVMLWTLLKSKFSSTESSSTEASTGSSPQPSPPNTAEVANGDAPRG